MRASTISAGDGTFTRAPPRPLRHHRKERWLSAGRTREIFGGAYGTAAQTRTRILVILRSKRANYLTLFRIHRIFDDHGCGGATQIADEGGVHIYSGATAASRSRIEGALRAAGFAYSEEPETFVTDDAPACPQARSTTA